MHGWLEVEILHKRVCQEEIVSPGEIAHYGEIERKEALVSNCIADVSALGEEAKLSGKGHFAYDVEGEVVEPLFKVHGLLRGGELIEPALKRESSLSMY